MKVEVSRMETAKSASNSALHMKALATTVLLALVSVSGCGLKKDPGASIGLAVTPESAYIVPGKGISCVAQAKAQTDSTTPTADIEGERVTFSRFALQWRSGDRLTIAEIRATIFSDGITGADTTDGFKVTVSEEEAAALLGLNTLTIPYSNPYNANQVLTVDSTATTKTSQGYAPCGLQLGGLVSATGKTTYSARIKIEVIGFGETCDTRNTTTGACESGAQYPVRQSVTVRAQKY